LSLPNMPLFAIKVHRNANEQENFRQLKKRMFREGGRRMLAQSPIEKRGEKGKQMNIRQLGQKG